MHDSVSTEAPDAGIGESFHSVVAPSLVPPDVLHPADGSFSSPSWIPGLQLIDHAAPIAVASGERSIHSIWPRVREKSLLPPAVSRLLDVNF